MKYQILAINHDNLVSASLMICNYCCLHPSINMIIVIISNDPFHLDSLHDNISDSLETDIEVIHWPTDATSDDNQTQFN